MIFENVLNSNLNINLTETSNFVYSVAEPWKLFFDWSEKMIFINSATAFSTRFCSWTHLNRKQQNQFLKL